MLFTRNEGIDETKSVFQMAKIKQANDWLKKQVLKDLLSPEEELSLVPCVWRKGWANWANNHPDPHVRKIALSVMCHSEEVARSNYHATSHINARDFTAAILPNMDQANLEVSDQAEVKFFSN